MLFLCEAIVPDQYKHSFEWSFSSGRNEIFGDEEEGPWMKSGKRNQQLKPKRHQA